MHPDDLKIALKTLGWTGVKLARAVDVTPKTVGMWLNGKARIPGSVKAYLKLKMRFLDLADSDRD